MNLKELLKKAKISHEELREELNIKSLSTISLKVNKKASITTREALIIKNLINSRLKTKYSIEDLFRE